MPIEPTSVQVAEEMSRLASLPTPAQPTPPPVDPNAPAQLSIEQQMELQSKNQLESGIADVVTRGALAGTPAGDTIAQILRGELDVSDYVDRAQAELDARMADDGWIKKFQSGDMAARREFEFLTTHVAVGREQRKLKQAQVSAA
jgi:hypothetical protein